MKKIIGILLFFLISGFIFFTVMGFIGQVPSELPEASVFQYKFLTGLLKYLNYIPSVVFSGFIVSFAIHFGRNSEGSAYRFSMAMMERYKIIIITSLILSFLLTLCSEVFAISILRKQRSLINRPKLVNEFIEVGKNLFENGDYEKSILYSEAALKLSPENKEAAKLHDMNDEEINRNNASNLRFELYQASKNIVRDDFTKVKINSAKINDAYKCYLSAKSNYEAEQWFNAHYYAQQGIKLYSPKDPNYDELKNIATKAWNNITEQRKLDVDEDNLIYRRKYDGYVALSQNDDLNAYYIFRDLYLTSRDLATDPDVIFYLNIAEQRINERCFFIDEVFRLESFEDVNDVCFSYSYKDGSKDIIYFRGMTSVKETGKTIQYLRDLTIKSISKDGELFRTMNVQYAKVLPVSVKGINSTTKALMGISEDINSIPYIMLNSIDRNDPDNKAMPVYTYSSGEVSNIPEYLLLPISYDDFKMLETSTREPDEIPFTNLFILTKKASLYGYSSEVYAHSLLNRLLYPFWIVIILVGLAIVAWNCRLGSTQYFKFSWLLGFPFLMVICQILKQYLIYIFKLLNYVIIGFFGVNSAIIAGFILNFIMLLCISVYFLGRRSKI